MKILKKKYMFTIIYDGYLFHGVLDTRLFEMVVLGHAVKGKKLQATIFLALGYKPKPFLLMSRTFHGIKRHLKLVDIKICILYNVFSYSIYYCLLFCFRLIYLL